MTHGAPRRTHRRRRALRPERSCASSTPRSRRPSARGRVLRRRGHPRSARRDPSASHHAQGWPTALRSLARGRRAHGLRRRHEGDRRPPRRGGPRGDGRRLSDDPAFTTWLHTRAARDGSYVRAVIARIERGELESRAAHAQGTARVPVRPARNVELSKFARRTVERARRTSRRGAMSQRTTWSASTSCASRTKSCGTRSSCLPTRCRSTARAMLEPAVVFQKRLGEIHDVDVAARRPPPRPHSARRGPRGGLHGPGQGPGEADREILTGARSAGGPWGCEGRQGEGRAWRGGLGWGRPRGRARARARTRARREGGKQGQWGGRGDGRRRHDDLVPPVPRARIALELRVKLERTPRAFDDFPARGATRA